MYVGTEEVEALAGQLSASLSKRLAANTALLESGTAVQVDLSALLTVIDQLSASGVSVIGDDNPLTPAACMHAATLALRVRGPSLHAIAPNLPPIDSRIVAPPQLRGNGNDGDNDKGSCLTDSLDDLEQCAAHAMAQLLSRFRDSFHSADLQAIVSQCMALLPRLPHLSTNLTRVLGTSHAFDAVPLTARRARWC
jgi:hypothetical protein